MSVNTTTVNYEKRKNQELFATLEKFEFEKTQNYIPIYQKFFSLSESNYNSINLNHNWYISNVLSKTGDNVYSCTIKHSSRPQEKKTKHIFFKSAPLLDPFKYMVGKYNVKDESLLNLPKLASIPNNEIVHPKIVEPNNSAYVDSFFSFLTSRLLNDQGFVHGLEYYGSFLAVKNNFSLNIFDDLEYLTESDYFKKNTNVLFKVEDYDDKFYDENQVQKLKPIKIIQDENAANLLNDAETLDESLFEGIFSEDADSNSSKTAPLTNENIRDLNEFHMTVEDVEDKNKTTTLRSGSTCSSRTSHTRSSDEVSQNSEDFSDDDHDDDASTTKKKNSNSRRNTEDEDSEENSNDASEYSSNASDECVYATLPKFPVQIICMEKCEKTLDSLLENEDLSEVEMFSILMQVIMILITYQKHFSFTHNDLHTNNIMYVKTKEEFLYYQYNKTYYRVPTFGKIFKIIDFGRAIYKIDGKLMCSDSFQTGEDAATQYNFEPYYNDKKPRLEPNYSFDLCRLACSIFDYLVDDMQSIQELEECEPIVKLIVEWCTDDNGLNILYKNNGADRYPDFKLYKMIARHVHNHTPQAQLERKEFAAFTVSKNKIPSGKNIMTL
jgi:hypothetical protein